MLLQKIIVAKGLGRQFSSATIDELLAGSMPHREFDQLVGAILRVRRKYFRDQALGKETYSLLNLLLQSNRLESTDLKDKVCGLL